MCATHHLLPCPSSHLPQFAVSQELLLREVARPAIQQVKAAPPSPQGAQGSPLLVTKGAAGGAPQGAKAAVGRVAMLCTCMSLPASRYTSHLPTGGAKLPAVPAVPDAAEEHDAQFPGEVMSQLSESVCVQLSAYHAAVADARVMKVRP